MNKKQVTIFYTDGTNETFQCHSWHRGSDPKTQNDGSDFLYITILGVDDPGRVVAFPVYLVKRIEEVGKP